MPDQSVSTSAEIRSAVRPKEIQLEGCLLTVTRSADRLEVSQREGCLLTVTRSADRLVEIQREGWLSAMSRSVVRPEGTHLLRSAVRLSLIQLDKWVA